MLFIQKSGELYVIKRIPLVQPHLVETLVVDTVQLKQTCVIRGCDVLVIERLDT